MSTILGHTLLATAAVTGLIILRLRATATAHATAAKEEDELLYVTLVCRHGARGPTKKALYLALGETPEQRNQRQQPTSDPHPATPAAKKWKPTELDALTAVGSAQLVALGQYFATFISQQPTILANTHRSTIKVRRSERPRVIASADSFMQGYATAAAGAAPPRTQLPLLQYLPYATLQQNVAVFRAWTGSEYNAHVDQVKHSHVYQHKGQESQAMLDATVVQCSPWSQSFNRSAQLNLTTYLHECLTCEAYSPDASKRSAGSLTDFFRTHQQAEKDLKNLALWSFDQRFINRATVGDRFGVAIGGALLNEMEQDFLVNGGKGGASVYVGHDYTILALMAALGVVEHPKEIMGFGGFGLMEYRRRRKTGEVYQRLMLQTTPFPDLNHPSTVSDKLPVEVWRKNCISYNEL